MQIAKLFGSIGFQVDTTGLQDFKKSMLVAKQEMSAFASEITSTQKTVKNLTTDLSILKKNLGLSVNTKDVKTSFRSLSTEVIETAKQLSRVNNAGGGVERRLETLDSKLSASILKWQEYRAEVMATANALGMIRGTVATPNSSIAGSIHQTTTGSASNPQTPRSTPNTPLFFGGLAGGNFFNTARQAIVGGLASAIPFALGAMTKNVITSGRDLRSANQVLLAHSDTKEDYQYNRQFIGRLTDETGVDLTESIRGFGRVLNATRAGGGTTDQAQRVFEAFAKYGTTMHLNMDENKRMIKALEQIFTNQRILGQEVNQFANVGIPMKSILKDISNGKLGPNSKEVVPEEIRKLAGSKAPDTVKLADWIAKYLVNTSMNNGAYQKATHSSQAEEGRTHNEWTQFSEYMMENGGDDALASFYRMVTSVVISMKQVSVALSGITTAVDNVTGIKGSGSLLWWVLALLLPIGRLGKGVSLLGRFFAYLVRIGRPVVLAFSLARGATGLLSVAVVGLRVALFSLLGVFGLVTLAIYLLVKAGQDIDDSNNGVLNWVDKLKVNFLYARVMTALLTRDLLRLFHLYGRTVDEGDGWFTAQPPKGMSTLENKGIIGEIFKYSVQSYVDKNAKADSLNPSRIAQVTGVANDGNTVYTTPVAIHVDGTKLWNFKIQNELSPSGNVQTSMQAY